MSDQFAYTYEGGIRNFTISGNMFVGVKDDFKGVPTSFTMDTLDSNFAVQKGLFVK